MSSDASPWWERFFGGENQLRWSALSNRRDPWADHVLPWVELAQDTNFDLPVVLPRLDSNDQTSWYCAGRSVRGALRLREALQAFIGPSYSDFNGRAYPLNTDDPIESTFAEGTVAPAYRIRASKPADVRRIQRAFELYLGLLRRIPKPEEHSQRPLGVLRSELDRALTVGDEAGARQLLERIRTIGRLDAENLLFLEVGVRAGLGQWREIAEDRLLLSRLTGLRLPPRVLADVHEALYRLHVEPTEDANAPSLALDAFRAAGLTQRSSLFGTRRGLRNARIVKAFFLHELAREGANEPLLQELARELEELDDPFAHALARLRPAIEAQPTADPMGEADRAFDDLEIDRSLELYLHVPASRKRLSRLILCAEHVGTTDAAKRVLHAIEPGDQVKNLPTSWSDRLRALEQKCAAGQSEQPPRGWLDWARRVQMGLSEDDAMTALREYMAVWDVAPLTSSKESVTELAGIINNAIGSAETVFREAAPMLYQAIMPDTDPPSRRVKPLLQILVTKIAFFADPSRNELELARDMTATLLSLGVDEKEYASLMADLEDLMGAQISIFTLGCCLDVAELLAMNACPDPELRLRLALRVIERARRVAHRLSPADILMVEQLCEDYDIDSPAEISGDHGADVAGPAEELSGKKVGIYTLLEAAGQRAATLLENLCPAVRVEVNSDHDCTKRLINLARNADLFIFAWKSSKHQAFYCVKDHRHSANPMVQAQGKGTSSILRAVLESV